MAILNLNPETLLISSEEARKAAEQYAQEYQQKKPYPYGGFDNFLPEEILERVLKELSDLPQAETSFDRAQAFAV